MLSKTQCYFAGRRLIVVGAGYVGGELARRAAGLGMQVTALTRNAAQGAVLHAAGIKVVTADLAGEEWHREINPEAHYVVNCVSSGGGGLEGYRHSYVAGMQSLLRWAAAGRIGTVLYTSSTSVYPQGDGAVIDETAPTGADNDRAALLVETEELLRSSRAAEGWFILRIAGIYGPGRHHLLEQLRAGGVLPGVGLHRLNLAHRDDICAAILATLSAGSDLKDEVFNVADDAPATKQEVASWLAAQLGRPEPRFDPAMASARRAIVPDRVILNRKLKQLTDWTPAFPDFRVGYRAILAAL